MAEVVSSMIVFTCIAFILIDDEEFTMIRNGYLYAQLVWVVVASAVKCFHSIFKCIIFYDKTKDPKKLLQLRIDGPLFWMARCCTWVYLAVCWSLILIDLWAFIMIQIVNSNNPGRFYQSWFRGQLEYQQVIFIRFYQIFELLHFVNFWKTYYKGRMAQTTTGLALLDKAKKETFNNLESSANKPDSDLECTICLVDFVPSANVVQLKCHRNHVYHRECML